MSKYFTLNQSLRSIFWLRSQSRLYVGFLVLAASLLIAASAQISIPLQPVPVTLQTFAVAFIGLTCGWRIGVYATILYLIEGALGLPVFADFTGGFGPLLGATGGYLLAFPLAAAIAGFLAQRGWARYMLSSFIAALLSLAVMCLIGFLFLASIIGFHQAWLLGVKPFLLGEFLKAIMLAVMVPAFWKRVI